MYLFIYFLACDPGLLLCYLPFVLPSVLGKHVLPCTFDTWDCPYLWLQRFPLMFTSPTGVGITEMARPNARKLFDACLGISVQQTRNHNNPQGWAGTTPRQWREEEGNGWQRGTPRTGGRVRGWDRSVGVCVYACVRWREPKVFEWFQRSRETSKPPKSQRIRLINCDLPSGAVRCGMVNLRVRKPLRQGSARRETRLFVSRRQGVNCSVANQTQSSPGGAVGCATPRTPR